MSTTAGTPYNKNRKDVRAAQVTTSKMSDASGTVGEAPYCLSRLLNVGSDGEEVTSTGRVFHTRAAATGKARSPTVDRRVEGTTTADVDDERRRRRESRSTTHWRSLARYDGARPALSSTSSSHHRHMSYISRSTVYTPVRSRSLIQGSWLVAC